jgi:speckle-type POZ protein
MSATSDAQPSLTASAIVAPAMSGSHILRIHGYSRTKGLGNAKFISSETFSVGGHRWCLKYCPDSHGSEDSDWISFFLHLDDTTVDEKTTVDEVKAAFEISLLDKHGNRVPSFSKSSLLCSFSSCQCTKGYELIKRCDLEGSVYLKDDVFSVRCDVTVAKEIFTKALPISEVSRRNDWEEFFLLVLVVWIAVCSLLVFSRVCIFCWEMQHTVSLLF